MTYKQLHLGYARSKSTLKKWLLMFILPATIIGNVTLPICAENGITQQTKKVTGTVLSKEDNEAIIGASILVEGTTISTATDLNGAFTLPNVPLSAKQIKVSYIGMKTQLLPIQSDMTILLENDSKLIDEVIVVAYGTAKKGSFTGSAGQVKADKLEDRPMTNATSALLGTVAGVQVSSTNGQPGSGSNVYIRGLGSFSASNTPLIVLNGMPYDNAISSINPDDIESMTVLKDASSAALYGARAANGVLLINTKTGNKDRMSVNVKINQGVTTRQSGDYKRLGIEDYLLVYFESARNKSARNMIDRLIKEGYSPADAARMTAEATPALAQDAAKNLIGSLEYNPFNVPNDQIVDANGKLNPSAKFMWEDDTDWMKAIQQLGNRTETNINVSGGNIKSDYYLSVGYLTEKGYIIGSQFDRYTMNTNVNSQINSFLKIGGTLSGNISKSIGEQDESSGNNSNPFRFTRYIGPIYPIHMHYADSKDYVRDRNGNLIYDFGTGYKDENGVMVAPTRNYVGGNNPAIELQNIYNGFKRNTLNAKAYSEIRFLDGFKLTLNGSVGANSYLRSSASVVYPEKQNSGSVGKTNSFTTTWTFNELLTYSKDFNKHHVDVLLGHESYDYEYNYLYMAMQDQNIDGIYEFGNYVTPGKPNSYTDTYRTEGYISRLNYDYANRYFFSASARRDASSRFYKNSHWGNFYSVGAGWRVDQEDFIKNLTFVDMLKLRASYGEVGNDDINTYYAWQATYEQATNGLEAGYIRNRVLNNQNLQWEKSQNSDIALECALFKNRLSGSLEFFNRQSSNLLFQIPKAPDTGIESAYQNAGTMYNRGVEIDVNSQIVKTKDVVWNVGFNATFLKNKITYLPVEPYISDVHRVEEGHSRYEFYIRQWAGVDPATGSSIYVPTEEALEKSTNLVKIGEKTYTTKVAEALRDWSGKSTPDVSGGITTGVSWKGISFKLLFNYQLGGKMYDSGYADLMVGPSGSASFGSTRHVDILNRWQKTGDVTGVPRIESFDDADLNAGSSTRWLVSSDMIELSNVTLSYDLPKKLINKYQVHGIRLYASADNVFLFTKRQGIYPRRNIFSGYSGNPDVFLPSRVFSMGLNLTF